MDAMITPAPLRGQISAIPSKSDAHRVLICAALCRDKTEILCPGAVSADIEATIACLSALGASFEKTELGYIVIPITGNADLATLHCGESGSTLRFLLPVAAALGKPFIAEGSGRLPQRPLDTLIGLLSSHGCGVSTPADASLPLTLTGRLTSGEFSLPGDISSQYISGLLMALPLLDGDSRILLTSPCQSADYVRMTLRTLGVFGIRVEEQADGYIVYGGQTFHSPGKAVIEGDWSNAAFWLCAGALDEENGITCAGLRPDSLQADRAIVDVLSRMGAEITERNSLYHVRGNQLLAVDFDASQAPDLAPVTAAIMALASGTSRIVNAGRLRLKESDRLHAMAVNLAALGVPVLESDDSLTITGVPSLSGGTVNGFGDHRIVMAMAAVSSRCKESLRITGAKAVNKSYPEFFDDFRRLGGDANVL